jgi:DNA polymerase-4
MVTAPIPAAYPDPDPEPDPTAITLQPAQEDEWPANCQIPAAQSPPPPQDPNSGPGLNWLFVDLNSYFASVEQEVRPELRGRPVAVVPMMADTTVCIAASYEAKAFGVKTGTVVADAKRMCPGIALVEGRHEIYTDYHHRVIEAVESCLPVTSVQSIDEMACRLIGRERPLLAALELGRKVKARIRERVGPMLRSSVGLATNRYLAKIASDMEKPDGLVALPLDILPEALAQLTLRDLPGIGAKTEKRLNAKGIHTMPQLLALNCEQAGELWGSVWGERLWHWLRGQDFDMSELEHNKSISHSHVLSPDMRTAEKAWAVAHKLLHKAAMRLRAADLWAGSIGLAIGFSVPRGQNAPVSRFGVPTRGWHSEIHLSECQDNQTLIAALSRLWAKRPQSKGAGTKADIEVGTDPTGTDPASTDYDQPYFVGVQLNNLVPGRLHSLNLFDALENTKSRTRLLAAMDELNHKYGTTALAPAAMLTAFKAAPTRIAFNSIPDLF